MEKEKVLEEYFLEEIPTTKEMIGWKVIGIVEDPKSNSADTYSELKTKTEGWLCEFQIKILKCGLILVSPECMMGEEDQVMEAARKIYSEFIQDQVVSDRDEIVEEWSKLVQQPYTITTSNPYPYWTTSTSSSPGITTYASSVTC